MIAKLIGGEPISAKYFTQTLLPDYIAANEEQCADWDVVYDARGHLIEPHTGTSVPLGTMAVREYLQPRYRSSSGLSIDIGGGGIDYDAEPKHRYKTALFIEKEGFEPLLAQARIRERFDCAILSTKGMSVVACRHLLDRLGRDGTVILVAHDFDRAGLAIAHTIANDGRRYTFEHTPEMIDIGLRLADVEAMDLQDEPAEDEGPAAEKLEEYGATDEEIAFLFGAKRRVELNAMTSRQFLDWLEGKLEEHGAGKVVPPLEMLESKARSAIALRLVSDRIAEIEDAARREAAAADAAHRSRRARRARPRRVPGSRMGRRGCESRRRGRGAMTPLPEADIDRLVKLCGMLGSDHSTGERAVAAEKASEFLRQRKLTWGDVLQPRSAEPPPLPAPCSGWRRIARECLDFHEAFGGLSGWETSFVANILARSRPPTPRQREVLDRIAESFGVGA